MGVPIKGEFPGSFATEILLRALGKEGLKDLWEQYKSVKMVRTMYNEPSAKEIRLANLVKKSGYAEASKQVGVRVELAYSAVNRVAKWNFYHDK